MAPRVRWFTWSLGSHWGAALTSLKKLKSRWVSRASLGSSALNSTVTLGALDALGALDGPKID